MKTLRKKVSVAAVCLLSLFLCIFGAVNAFAYETVIAEIPVDCFMISMNYSQTYVVKLELESEEAPVPEQDTLEIDSNNGKAFRIAVTEPGTFRYKIYEVAGDNKKIEYDDDVYTVTLFVENGPDDKLVPTVVAGADGSGRKAPRIKFENKVLGDSEMITTTSAVTLAAEATVTTSSVTAAAAATTAATTTAAVTTSAVSGSGDKISEIVDAVLTGDSFPAHAVRSVLIISFAAAIVTFLFKRNNSEEEEKNND